MKKFSLLVLCSAGLLLTGCDKELINQGNNSSNNNNNNIVEDNTKGNCTAVECIKQINVENTVEEINNIIGFEGELIDEKYNKYYWELSEDSGIEVVYYSDTKGTIKAEFENDVVKDSRVDLSRFGEELQPRIREGITYDEFITYIGNVEGNVIEKSSYSTDYIWVGTDGSYLKATFNNSTRKCSFASGMIY